MRIKTIDYIQWKNNALSIYGMTKKEAEFILQCMRENIKRYGYASADDLFTLAGEPPVTPILETIGWKSLDNARVRWSLRGYKIIFPPTRVLV